MPSFGKCKFCGQTKKLINAHIIPKSLYPFDSGNTKGAPLEVIHPKERRRSRSPQGEYDQKLVCLDCEKKFARYDDYAVRFFRRNFPYTLMERRRGNAKVYRFENFNYKNLKLFFLALLWRAGNTEREFFYNISLSPDENAILRDSINTKDPGGRDFFSPVIVRYRDEDGLSSVMANPFGSFLRDVKFFRFYFSGFQCLIKCDSQSAHKNLFPFVLQPNQPLRVLELPFRETKEFRNVLEAIQDLDSE